MTNSVQGIHQCSFVRANAHHQQSRRQITDFWKRYTFSVKMEISVSKFRITSDGMWLIYSSTGPKYNLRNLYIYLTLLCSVILFSFDWLSLVICNQSDGVMDRALKHHYVDIGFLCYLAPPTVSECNTTVIKANPRFVTDCCSFYLRLYSFITHYNYVYNVLQCSLDTSLIEGVFQAWKRHKKIRTFELLCIYLSDQEGSLLHAEGLVRLPRLHRIPRGLPPAGKALWVQSRQHSPAGGRVTLPQR